MKTTLIDPMKRKLITLIGLLPWLSACSAAGLGSDGDLASKYRGIRGVIVRTDAIGEKRFVTIVSDTNKRIEEPALLSSKRVGNLTYTDNSMPVPKTVRVTWREGDVKRERVKKADGTTYPPQWLGGTIIGDYTIEVASRIPDAVLDSIRNEGGALRLKFRLKDDGVLLGWDIERPGGGISRYSMAGGDFREAYIYNGKVVEPGWHIDKNGQKVETDF